ncbi:MAG TPA: NAD(P)H-dependent oxidoreductase [Candidatus Cloacimonadota bacterium]|nr:NAD(P)H-dependent oxidoreductase [Candidatus Cloacimonadota bacterium]
MKILLIQAHPRLDSYCHSLAEAYYRGAKTAGHDVRVVELPRLNFEQYLMSGQKDKIELTEELLDVQRLFLWADLLVFAYPTWWTAPPALLKLFLEIILAPSFAYKYHKSKGLIPRWDKLLRGKKARLIVTMDAPPLYYKLFIRDPGYKMMNASLRFCGVKPVQRTYFGSVKLSSGKVKRRWLEKAENLGEKE